MSMHTEQLCKYIEQNDLLNLEAYLKRWGKGVVNETTSGLSPLLFAVKMGHYDITKCLLENNADVRYSPYISDNLEVRKYFPANTVTAKSLAIENNDKAMLSLIDSYEATHDIKWSDKYGEIKLFSAVKTNDVAAIIDLLKRGSNVNHKNYDGETILHVAMSSGVLVEVVQMLLGNNADVNMRDKMGRTPLFDLCNHCSNDTTTIDKMLMLIEHGVDVNADGNRNDWESGGYTPLILLTLFNEEHSRNIRVKAANVLLLNGADLTKKDNYNYTAMHYSVVNRNMEMIDLLLSYGADPNEIIDGKKIADTVVHRRFELTKANGLVTEALQLIQDGHYSSARSLMQEVLQYKTVLVKEMFDRIQRDCDSKAEYAVRYMEYLHRNNHHKDFSIKAGVEYSVKSLLYHTFFG